MRTNATNYTSMELGISILKKFVIALMALILSVSTPLSANNGIELARRVHPNPFRTSTTFQLRMPQVEKIQIIVFDIIGRKVRVLHDGLHPPGDYPIFWDGNDDNGVAVPQGTYICTLFANDVPVNSVKVIKLVG